MVLSWLLSRGRKWSLLVSSTMDCSAMRNASWRCCSESITSGPILLYGTIDGGSNSPRRKRTVNTRRSEFDPRSEEHTSELQSPCNLVCRLLLEKKKETTRRSYDTR